MPEYTFTFLLRQERQIVAADLAGAKAEVLRLMAFVPGARLHSILRNDVKRDPFGASCKDCAAEQKLRKKRLGTPPKPTP